MIDLLPLHRAWTFPSAISDHFSVVLEWRESSSPCIFPFKFNHSWLDFDDFVNMIRKEWLLLPHDSSYSGMESFSRKLRLLKKKIKDWTHHKSLEMKDKSFLIETKIHNLISSSPTGIYSCETLSILNSLQSELKKMRIMRSSLPKLKAG